MKSDMEMEIDQVDFIKPSKVIDPSIGKNEWKIMYENTLKVNMVIEEQSITMMVE